MKFSASLLKTWMACPLQAKFQEVDKLPWRQNGKASYGTCMHDALELYNSGATIEETIARFKTTWYSPEMLNVKPDYWPKFTTYTGLLKKGVETLQDYHDIHQIVDREVIGTEIGFCVPFGEHELSGFVDLVEVGKDNSGAEVLRIVDYKTNGKAPTQLDLALDIQFTIYMYASMQPEFWTGTFREGWHPPMVNRYPGFENGEELYERFQNHTRRGVWYHLNTNKEIAVGVRADEDFMRLYRCLNEIEKAIKAEVYVPCISGDTCTYCSYRDVCPVVMPVLDKLEDEVEPL